MKVLIPAFTSLLSFALLTACGPSTEENSTPSIFGGVTPSNGGLIENSTVSLGGTRPYCSGTLIGIRTVVTAAHCVAGSRQGSITIGFTDNGRIASTVRSSGHAAHERYGRFGSGQRYDIAIVALAEDAPAGHTPVEIYDGELQPGDEVYSAGYGRTESGSGGKLLYTGTPVKVRSTSADEIFYDYRDTNSGTCNGDSGGPAYVYTGTELQVVGAVSRGAGNCRGLSIDTKVTAYQDWIATTRANL